MANSTWMQATNRVLLLSGLAPIQAAANFDSVNNSQLLKYQSTCKMFVQLAHDMLATRLTRHFAERRISFPIDPPQAGQLPQYPLDVGISPEFIKEGSFFNVTQTNATGTTSAAQNRRIHNWPYEDFILRNPDQSIIAAGAPQRWILVPIDRSVGTSQVEMIQIYPPPDQHYDLELQAKLNPPILTLNTDQILFPPRYEYALSLKSWAMVERDLGEGKEGTIEQLAQQAANEVRLSSVKPDEIRNAPRMMRIRGVRGGYQRAYNSPPSVNAQGQVIDG